MMRANRQVADEQTDKPDREVARDKRRAEALRANLKRRKVQLRARADQTPQPDQAADVSGEPAKDEQ